MERPDEVEPFPDALHTLSGALADEVVRTPASDGLQKFFQLPEGETFVTEDIANAPEFLDAARDVHCFPKFDKPSEPARAVMLGSTKLLIINCEDAIVPLKTILIVQRGALGRKLVHALAMPVYGLRGLGMDNMRGIWMETLFQNFEIDVTQRLIRAISFTDIIIPGSYNRTRLTYRFGAGSPTLIKVEGSKFTGDPFVTVWETTPAQK